MIGAKNLPRISAETATILIAIAGIILGLLLLWMAISNAANTQRAARRPKKSNGRCPSSPCSSIGDCGCADRQGKISGRRPLRALEPSRARGVVLVRNAAGMDPTFPDPFPAQGLSPDDSPGLFLAACAAASFDDLIGAHHQRSGNW
jgi:hypothetical protein